MIQICVFMLAKKKKSTLPTEQYSKPVHTPFKFCSAMPISKRLFFINMCRLTERRLHLPTFTQTVLWKWFFLPTIRHFVLFFFLDHAWFRLYTQPKGHPLCSLSPLLALQIAGVTSLGMLEVEQSPKWTSVSIRKEENFANSLHKSRNE